MDFSGGNCHNKDVNQLLNAHHSSQEQIFSLDNVQSLHKNITMPTIHRFANMTIRVNVPDHRPPHVHVVMSDRRDAFVELATLKMISRTLRASDIADALIWIEANRAYATQIFTECNP